MAYINIYIPRQWSESNQVLEKKRKKERKKYDGRDFEKNRKETLSK